MKTFISLIFFTMCCLHDMQAQEHKRGVDSESTILNLNKHQLAALDVAIRQMRRTGQSFRGQQARIDDHGESFYVAFMDDPIDMRVAGSQNGITWEIRKRDLKVLRRIFDR
jgi:hypothetical protein